jgi:hypothetical protein
MKYTYSIVTATLITDFYLRMKESKENKRIFILKHLYEIPALIPLVFFGIFESYSFLNVVFRLLSSFVYLESYIFFHEY